MTGEEEESFLSAGKESDATPLPEEIGVAHSERSFMMTSSKTTKAIRKNIKRLVKGDAAENSDPAVGVDPPDMLQQLGNRITALEETLDTRITSVEETLARNGIGTHRSQLVRFEQVEKQLEEMQALLGKTCLKPESSKWQPFNKDHTAPSDFHGCVPDACQIDVAQESFRQCILREVDSKIEECRHNGKILPDGSHTMTKEELKSLDVNYLMQEYAKDQIIKSTSNAELLMNAELLIEEDWLAKVDALPGNLFGLAAFGEFQSSLKHGFSLANARQWLLEMTRVYAKYFGCILIVLIQLIGPPLVFTSRMPGNSGVLDEKRYDWRCWYFSPSYDMADEQECPGGKLPGEVYFYEDWKTIASTRFLSVIFALAFILNGVFVLKKEKDAWKQIYNTLRYLDKVTPTFKVSGLNLLAFGGVVNAWVVFWSCLDMYVVVCASFSPQDLLLDGLALLFLYNLDDIGGDLGFISDDDWPGLRLAWIYQEIVHPCPDEDFDEDILDRRGQILVALYDITLMVLMILLILVPLLACITPFTQIAPSD